MGDISMENPEGWAGGGGVNVFLKGWGILFEISCSKGLDIF